MENIKIISLNSNCIIDVSIENILKSYGTYVEDLSLIENSN